MNEFIWNWLNIQSQINYLTNVNKRKQFMNFKRNIRF